MPKKYVPISFPFGGLNRQNGYEAQPPGTSAYMLNVRPRTQAEGDGKGQSTVGRTRGGRRAGLTKHYSNQFGSTNPINLITRFNGGVAIASNGSFYFGSGTSQPSLVTSSYTTNTIRPQICAALGQELFITQSSIPTRASGTNGVLSGGLLDSASVADWTAISIDVDNYVVEISGNSTGQNATYGITTIHATNGLTLTPTPSDATGLTFKVRKGIGVYSATANTLTAMRSTSMTTGVIPCDCPIIARFNGRIILAGDGTGAWYASRQGDARDFNVGASDLDPARAFASTSADFFTIGNQITAVMPFHDDYCLFATPSELYVMRGDPGAGGTISLLSDQIGVSSRTGWCTGPAGEIYFVSTSGLYVCGVGARPQKISGPLPGEFLGTRLDEYVPVMCYDSTSNGIYYALTDMVASGNNAGMFWFDLSNGSFWPMEIDVLKIPHSMATIERNMASNTAVNAINRFVLGCFDGYVRYFDATASNDDGSTITNYVGIGPILLGTPRTMEGLLDEISAVLPPSTSLPWKIYTGDTAQVVYAAALAGTTPRYSGTFTDTRPVFPVGLRGVWAMIVLGTTGAAWEMESLIAGITPNVGMWRP